MLKLSVEETSAMKYSSVVWKTRFPRLRKRNCSEASIFNMGSTCSKPRNESQSVSVIKVRIYLVGVSFCCVSYAAAVFICDVEVFFFYWSFFFLKNVWIERFVCLFVCLRVYLFVCSFVRLFVCCTNTE